MSVVSIIAALTAPITVVAALCTTWLTRHYDLKQKQLELYETRRLDAVNAFADAFSKLHKSSVNSDSYVRAALSATYAVIPFVRDSSREPFHALIGLLRSGGALPEVYRAFDECLSLFESSSRARGHILLKLRSLSPTRLRR